MRKRRLTLLRLVHLHLRLHLHRLGVQSRHVLPLLFLQFRPPPPQI